MVRDSRLQADLTFAFWVAKLLNGNEFVAFLRDKRKSNANTIRK
jgi:hypothetical protein